MNLPDSDRIAALAVRLDLAPRQVFVLAARMAGSEAAPDSECLDAELQHVRAASDAAADLAMLAYASYALDDIDRALVLVWSDSHNRGL